MSTFQQSRLLAWIKGCAARRLVVLVLFSLGAAGTLGVSAQPAAERSNAPAEKAPAEKAPSEKPATPGSDLAQVLESGVLRYTSIPEQMSPFLRIDLDSLGKNAQKVAHGIDAELLAHLANKLGTTLELVLPEQPIFEEVWRRLDSGDAQIVAGALSILPTREAFLDFSDPYFSTDLVVIGRKGSPWKSVKACRGLKVALIDGASTAYHWKRLVEPPPEQVVQVDFTIAALAAVSEGEADITVEDELYVRPALKALPDLEALFTVPIQDQYGLVFREGSELKHVFNELLDELKQSGELQRIIDRHLPD